MFSFSILGNLKNTKWPKAVEIGRKILRRYILYKFLFYRSSYVSRKAVLPKHDSILHNILKFMFVNFV
jgi:hypothetical protein